MIEIIPAHGIDVRLEDLFRKHWMVSSQKNVDFLELQQTLLLYDLSVHIW